MGRMRFVVPAAPPWISSSAARAYVQGLDRIPWRTQVSVHPIYADSGEDTPTESGGDVLLTVDREVTESGCLFLPWQVGAQGEVMVGTGSLIERSLPYLLPLELARGTLYRLREQLADSDSAGVQISADCRGQLHALNRAFAQAAVLQHQDPVEACRISGECLAAALQLGAALGTGLARFVLDLRRARNARISTLLAGPLDRQQLAGEASESFLSAFNAAAVQFAWPDLLQAVPAGSGNEPQWEVHDAQLDWCRNHGLRVCGGPLLRLERGFVPDWLYLWEDNYDQLEACFAQFTETVVKRFLRRVDVWLAASQMNVSHAIQLGDEERLRLCATVVQQIRRHDPQAPIVVSVDQPWAEFMGNDATDLSPLQFAEELLRAEIGLAGVGLELNFGYWPGGSLPRGLTDVLQLLDYWSQLGVPLLINLTAPSEGPGPEAPQATGCREPRAYFRGGPSEAKQAAFIEELLPLLISNPAVHGVIWNQLSDGPKAAFPGGGLFNARHEPKPVLGAIARARQSYLG